MPTPTPFLRKTMYRCAVPQQRSFRNQPVERSLRPGVNPRIVRIGICGQVDVGSPYVEKAVGIPLGQRCCFRTVHHVIGNAGDGGGQLRSRAECAEWLDSHLLNVNGVNSEQ